MMPAAGAAADAVLAAVTRASRFYRILGRERLEFPFPRLIFEKSPSNLLRALQLRRALGSLKAEDEQTVERVGEQLGALESQITDTIKGNVMLRKEVWVVHKLPGFPGHRGIPGVDGRPGRSSVIGPGGYAGPAGPPGVDGSDGQSGPRGEQGEIGVSGPRGRCVAGSCVCAYGAWMSGS
jgi:hypothetical protein